MLRSLGEHVIAVRRIDPHVGLAEDGVGSQRGRDEVDFSRKAQRFGRFEGHLVERPILRRLAFARVTVVVRDDGRILGAPDNRVAAFCDALLFAQLAELPLDERIVVGVAVGGDELAANLAMHAEEGRVRAPRGRK